MPISAETKAWLDDLKKDGGLSDDQFKTIESALTDKADEFIKGSVHRQSDYSKRMAEVQQAQAALQAKEQQVTKFQTDLAGWQSSAKPAYEAALKAREAAEAKLAATIGRLKTIAETNGLPLDVVMKDIDTVTQKTQEQSNNQGPDLSQYVRREDINKVAQESAFLEAALSDISDEYQDLFGSRIPSRVTLVQEALQSGKGLRQYVEEKFNFSGKRAEKAKAELDEKIRVAKEEGRTQALSEMQLPGAGAGKGFRDDLPSSPVFRQGGLPAPTTPGGQGAGGVSAAIAAFNTRKYASK